MTGYVKTFKGKNDRLMSYCTDYYKLLRKYETIWTKIEEFFTCL